ncbi:hypothetical protein BESB_071290 [Besnoitia besnoiti]|uniref:Hydrolase n=1 Tax=Besnoitia besnoiti TaxID=94643 RepID=A0A2A9MEC2_BESBE|nr:uncharacterized protein BESB_071290 [Besnoitia besnoiti]PFH33977.1 hypothetical protein BESB_071290 [Besnoitia besnoiti]
MGTTYSNPLVDSTLVFPAPPSSYDMDTPGLLLLRSKYIPSREVPAFLIRPRLTPARRGAGAPFTGSLLSRGLPSRFPLPRAVFASSASGSAEFPDHRPSSSPCLASGKQEGLNSLASDRIRHALLAQAGQGGARQPGLLSRRRSGGSVESNVGGSGLAERASLPPPLSEQGDDSGCPCALAHSGSGALDEACAAEPLDASSSACSLTGDDPTHGSAAGRKEAALHGPGKTFFEETEGTEGDLSGLGTSCDGSGGRRKDGKGFCILYFHGNACDANMMRGWLQILADELGATILIFEYPGYGLLEDYDKSSRGIDLCARIAFEFLVDKLLFPIDRIILCGRSIGTGAAAWLASHLAQCNVQVGGLVLLSPYVSLSAVAADWADAPLALTNVLVHHHWNNEAAIESIPTVPLCIIHGKEDDVIPMAHTKRLWEAARQPPSLRVARFAETDHNVGMSFESFYGDILVPLQVFFRKVSSNLRTKKAAGVTGRRAVETASAARVASRTCSVPALSVDASSPAGVSAGSKTGSSRTRGGAEGSLSASRKAGAGRGGAALGHKREWGRRLASHRLVAGRPQGGREGEGAEGGDVDEARWLSSATSSPPTLTVRIRGKAAEDATPSGESVSGSYGAGGISSQDTRRPSSLSLQDFLAVEAKGSMASFSKTDSNLSSSTWQGPGGDRLRSSRRVPSQRASRSGAASLTRSLTKGETTEHARGKFPVSHSPSHSGIGKWVSLSHSVARHDRRRIPSRPTVAGVGSSASMSAGVEDGARRGSSSSEGIEYPHLDALLSCERAARRSSWTAGDTASRSGHLLVDSGGFAEKRKEGDRGAFKRRGLPGRTVSLSGPLARGVHAPTCGMPGRDSGTGRARDGGAERRRREAGGARDALAPVGRGRTVGRGRLQAEPSGSGPSAGWGDGGEEAREQDCEEDLETEKLRPSLCASCLSSSVVDHHVDASYCVSEDIDDDFSCLAEDADDFALFDDEVSASEDCTEPSETVPSVSALLFEGADPVLDMPLRRIKDESARDAEEGEQVEPAGRDASPWDEGGDPETCESFAEATGDDQTYLNEGGELPRSSSAVRRGLFLRQNPTSATSSVAFPFRGARPQPPHSDNATFPAPLSAPSVALSRRCLPGAASFSRPPTRQGRPQTEGQVTEDVVAAESVARAFFAPDARSLSTMLAGFLQQETSRALQRERTHKRDTDPALSSSPARALRLPRMAGPGDVAFRGRETLLSPAASSLSSASGAGSAASGGSKFFTASLPRLERGLASRKIERPVRLSDSVATEAAHQSFDATGDEAMRLSGGRETDGRGAPGGDGEDTLASKGVKREIRTADLSSAAAATPLRSLSGRRVVRSPESAGRMQQGGDKPEEADAVFTAEAGVSAGSPWRQCSRLLSRQSLHKAAPPPTIASAPSLLHHLPPRAGWLPASPRLFTAPLTSAPPGFASCPLSLPAGSVVDVSCPAKEERGKCAESDAGQAFETLRDELQRISYSSSSSSPRSGLLSRVESSDPAQVGSVVSPSGQRGRDAPGEHAVPVPQRSLPQKDLRRASYSSFAASFCSSSSPPRRAPASAPLCSADVPVVPHGSRPPLLGITQPADCAPLLFASPSSPAFCLRLHAQSLAIPLHPPSEKSPTDACSPYASCSVSSCSFASASSSACSPSSYDASSEQFSSASVEASSCGSSSLLMPSSSSPCSAQGHRDDVCRMAAACPASAFAGAPPSPSASLVSSVYPSAFCSASPSPSAVSPSSASGCNSSHAPAASYPPSAGSLSARGAGPSAPSVVSSEASPSCLSSASSLGAGFHETVLQSTAPPSSAPPPSRAFSPARWRAAPGGRSSSVELQISVAPTFEVPEQTSNGFCFLKYHHEERGDKGGTNRDASESLIEERNETQTCEGAVCETSEAACAADLGADEWRCSRLGGEHEAVAGSAFGDAGHDVGGKKRHDAEEQTATEEALRHTSSVSTFCTTATSSSSARVSTARPAFSSSPCVLPATHAPPPVLLTASPLLGGSCRFRAPQSPLRPDAGGTRLSASLSALSAVCREEEERERRQNSDILPASHNASPSDRRFSLPRTADVFFRPRQSPQATAEAARDLSDAGAGAYSTVGGEDAGAGAYSTVGGDAASHLAEDVSLSADMGTTAEGAAGALTEARDEREAEDHVASSSPVSPRALGGLPSPSIPVSAPEAVPSCSLAKDALETARADEERLSSGAAAATDVGAGGETAEAAEGDFEKKERDADSRAEASAQGDALLGRAVPMDRVPWSQSLFSHIPLCHFMVRAKREQAEGAKDGDCGDGEQSGRIAFFSSPSVRASAGLISSWSPHVLVPAWPKLPTRLPDEGMRSSGTPQQGGGGEETRGWTTPHLKQYSPSLAQPWNPQPTHDKLPRPAGTPPCAPLSPPCLLSPSCAAATGLAFTESTALPAAEPQSPYAPPAPAEATDGGDSVVPLGHADEALRLEAESVEQDGRAGWEQSERERQSDEEGSSCEGARPAEPLSEEPSGEEAEQRALDGVLQYPRPEVPQLPLEDRRLEFLTFVGDSEEHGGAEAAADDDEDELERRPAARAGGAERGDLFAPLVLKDEPTKSEACPPSLKPISEEDEELEGGESQAASPPRLPALLSEDGREEETLPFPFSRDKDGRCASALDSSPVTRQTTCSGLDFLFLHDLEPKKDAESGMSAASAAFARHASYFADDRKNVCSLGQVHEFQDVVMERDDEDNEMDRFHLHASFFASEPNPPSAWLSGDANDPDKIFAALDSPSSCSSSSSSSCSTVGPLTRRQLGGLPQRRCGAGEDDWRGRGHGRSLANTSFSSSVALSRRRRVIRYVKRDDDDVSSILTRDMEPSPTSRDPTRLPSAFQTSPSSPRRRDDEGAHGGILIREVCSERLTPRGTLAREVSTSAPLLSASRATSAALTAAAHAAAAAAAYAEAARALASSEKIEPESTASLASLGRLPAARKSDALAFLEGRLPLPGKCEKALSCLDARRRVSRHCSVVCSRTDSPVGDRARRLERTERYMRSEGGGEARVVEEQRGQEGAVWVMQSAKGSDFETHRERLVLEQKTMGFGATVCAEKKCEHNSRETITTVSYSSSLSCLLSSFLPTQFSLSVSLGGIQKEG